MQLLGGRASECKLSLIYLVFNMKMGLAECKSLIRQQTPEKDSLIEKSFFFMVLLVLAELRQFAKLVCVCLRMLLSS